MKYRTIGIGVVLCSLIVSAESAEWTVKSAHDVQNIAKKAKPGDTLVMADGVWTDQKIWLKCNGSPKAPITSRPETPGGVSLTGNSSVNLRGSYMVVDGLVFRDITLKSASVVTIGTDELNKTNHCRLTNTDITFGS